MYLYGNVVIIDHGLGVYTSYNHMDSIAVAEGQHVDQGQYLGAMGETGFVNGLCSFDHIATPALVVGSIHTWTASATTRESAASSA